VVEEVLKQEGFSQDRLRALTLTIIVAFAVLALRLFHLQVIRGSEIAGISEKNRTQIIFFRAPRGHVLDKNGEILLDNIPSFSIMFSPKMIKKEKMEEVEKELANWLPGFSEKIHKQLTIAWRTKQTVRVLEDVSRSIALGLMERKARLPGVTIITEPKRRSRLGGYAGHLLGYVDEINREELNNLSNEGYRMGQLIGRTGIEKTYDSYLSGTGGGLQFEVDATGRHTRVLHNLESHSGNDIFLTIDKNIQLVAEKALLKTVTKHGAAVAIDPWSGKILAMASVPGYDSGESIVQLLNDPELPLFNRAIQGGYPAGSIFKVIMSLAAIEEGKIQPDTEFKCNGKFRLGNKEFKCWKRHQTQDFWGGVAHSCNVYFFNVGLLLGNETIIRYANALGLGEKTKVDLPFEDGGLIPTQAWIQKENLTWYEGDTVNLSIGQGYVLLTPIQAAQMIASVANEGTIWQPYVVQRIVGPNGKLIMEKEPGVKKQVSVKPETWGILKKALVGVVEEGTGRGIYRKDLVIAGKTGTAQNPHGEDHAWFVAYAGYPDSPPKIAVAVFVEHGGHGAESALPVARAIVREAFRDSI